MRKWTDAEIWVLVDMLDEWMDKDRHDELVRDRDYTEGDIEALSSLNSKAQGEVKRRRFYA
ncbi:hypothetical protein ABZV77_11350 [Streptomyces sp. NPDC004732]|uniref:hypothetical protein n=1 Tax=Streptomyces sp. NPDC004732 TaxID=3154290 RepID=UPI0033BE7775